MTRPLIVATLCPLATAYLTGCGVVCRGPACADQWDVGQAIVLPGSPDRLTTADAVQSADRSWLGTVTEGPDWSVAAGNGEVVLGTPGSSEVWILPSDTGGSLSGNPWTDGTSFGFGTTVARGASATWVGNPEADLAAGALYRYPIGASQPDLTLSGAGPGDRLGQRVWMCGDLDGDGIEDVVASMPWFAPQVDFPLADPTSVAALGGAALLVLSTELAADPSRPIWELGRLWWGSAVGDALGAGASCEADLDGDDFPDVALGAPYAGTADDGAIYVLSGASLPASGMVSEQATSTVAGDLPVAGEPATVGAWLGFDLGTIHEERSDRTLLTAGAPGQAAGAGAVWVFSVTPNRMDLAARYEEVDPAAGGFHVGRFVTHADIDGDGREDLVVGAPDWKEGRNGYDAGRVFVVYGGQTWNGVGPLEPDTTWTATQPFARIGRGIQAIDLDGDGADELLLPTRTAILP